MIRCVPSVPTLVRVFIMNGCWILSNVFSASIEMIMWCLTFLSLMWFVTLIDLHLSNYPNEPGMNPTWLWCLIFFMCGRIQLVKIFENFFVYVHQRYWPIIFVFVESLVLVSG